MPKAVAGVHLCVGSMSMAPLALTVGLWGLEICSQILGRSLQTANLSP